MVKKRFGVILAIMLIVNCFGAVGSYAEEIRDNIALFSYSGGTAKAEMTEGNKTSGYPATGGTAKSSSLLFASISGTTNSAMSWSKAEYVYGGSSTAVVPRMEASTSDLWGSAPYFLIKTSTKGYENIRFSARISGTNKGPRDYSLQYSTDGTTFKQIKSASVSGNKNLDNNQIFADVIIPEAAADSAEVYFKIVAASTTTIGETDFEGQSGGEAAINDIAITGTAVSGKIPTLETPSVNAPEGEIYSNRAVELTAAEGASIFYSTDGTTFNIYTEPLYLFKDTADESVTLKVYASKEGYNDSAVGTYTYTCVSDEIAGFSFNSADSIEYVNGMIKATSGIYNDAKMIASIDTVNKYVPMFDAEMNAAVIAPDDSIAWSDGTYWQFELSTLGYNRIYISADACSSNKGPLSMTLQYSTDGVNFKNVSGFENKAFAGEALERYYNKAELPSDAAGRNKIYVRISSLQNMSFNNGGSAIWGVDKGNTYINNVEFLGDRNSQLKTPVTTKKTDYFGVDGTIKYTSPDGADMRYNIYDKNEKIIVSNAQYSEEGIALAKLPQFDAVACNTFRIEIWSENNGAKSAANSKTFTYKGDYIALFDIDENTMTGTLEEFGATGGALADKTSISMKPDGQNNTSLSVSSGFNLRTSAENNNTWKFDETRTSPSDDGGWIISTSTKGYKNIVLTAEQSSTSKGPRDFCLAYSTDNVTFKNIANSSVKLTGNMESTYANFLLPAEVENLDRVYIKIKIDGGETVLGLEITSDKDEYDSDTTKYVYGSGNTDINSIELCATPIENKISVGAQTLEKGKTYNVYYESQTDEGSVIVAAYDANYRLISCRYNIDEFTVPENAEYIKIMLWDSIGKMHSLAEPVYKEVQ